MDGRTDRRTDGQHAISIPRYALVHRAVKTGVVFLDLTAAYDAVWQLGLLQKLSKTLLRWIVDTVALFPERQTLPRAQC